MLTGTVAGALYAVARLAALFSLLSLGYGLVLAAFVVPKVRVAGADGQQSLRAAGAHGLGHPLPLPPPVQLLGQRAAQLQS